MRIADVGRLLGLLPFPPGGSQGGPRERAGTVSLGIRAPAEYPSGTDFL